jgi:hypothetical protein
MHIETGSEQLNHRPFNDDGMADEETPLLVLQRNQMSIGAFLANNGIFSLTIVCAVLGVVTSYQSSDEQNSSVQKIGLGMTLKSANDSR